MAEDVVETVAARIEAFVGGRPVYRYAVPPGTLPDAYLVVIASAGETTSTNMACLADLRSPFVDVRSVARDVDRSAAARESSWGARRVVDAMTDWRPSLGREAHLPKHEASHPPRPDEDLPDAVMVTVERWTLAYQP